LIRSLVLLPADLFGSSFTLQPNQSPEPTASIAGSSASRLDVIWSRMAQLFSLGSTRIILYEYLQTLRLISSETWARLYVALASS
jgi:hypothetical protein